MLIYSTLFNSSYLDKGIVMYRSLLKVTKDFRLYIFAFDEKCYDIMKTMECENLRVVSLKEFESVELLEAKNNRTSQEYCWTCSCHTIKHVLEKYNENHCTYIDADMYFYNDPHVLFKELMESKCDVGIIEHRMPRSVETDRMVQLSGKYCIEYNTFMNTENGTMILNWWCNRCLECCTASQDGVHFGDQKYLDDWMQRFQGVHEVENLGAGVAPWNLSDYREVAGKDDIIYSKVSKMEIPLIFFHFQSMKYINENMVDINVNMYPYKVDYKLIKNLYIPYLRTLQNTRKELAEHYQFDIEQIQHYSPMFDKKKYFKEDIMGERNLKVFFGKIWRVLIRKSKDYIELS